MAESDPHMAIASEFEAGDTAGPEEWTQSAANLARWETVASRTRGGIVDVLLISTDGFAIRRHVDLMRSVAERQSSEIATLKIQRGNRVMEVRTELPGVEGYVLRFSFRRDAFPVIFECDVPLLPEECGGPLFGIDGQILGISIARIGPHGCAAIPAHLFHSLLGVLKAGRPLDSLSHPPAPTKKPIPMVSTTVGERKNALTTRAEIMNSLLVE